MLGIILCRGKELGLASEFAFWRSPKTIFVLCATQQLIGT